MKPGVSTGPLLSIALVLAAVWASFAYLDMPLGALFSGAAAGEAAGFVQRFVPPDLSPEFLGRVGFAALETLAISLLSTLIAALAGAALALPAARSTRTP